MLKSCQLECSLKLVKLVLFLYFDVLLKRNGREETLAHPVAVGKIYSFFSILKIPQSNAKCRETPYI